MKSMKEIAHEAKVGKIIAEFNENKKHWTNKKRKSETGNDFIDFLVHKKIIK